MSLQVPARYLDGVLGGGGFWSSVVAGVVVPLVAAGVRGRSGCSGGSTGGFVVGDVLRRCR